MKHLIIVSILFAVVQSNNIIIAAPELNSVQNYMLKAEKDIASGEYKEAIENCRKVLYLQPINAKAAFLLGESLNKDGSFKKAIREYLYCLDIIEDDKNLLPEAKATLKKQIKERLENLKNVEKETIKKNENSVSVPELILLFWAIVTSIVFIAKGMSLFLSILEKNKAKKTEEKIWLDRYWITRSGRELVKTKHLLLKLIIYVILASIIVAGVRTLCLYGPKEIYMSVKQLF